LGDVEKIKYFLILQNDKNMALNFENIFFVPSFVEI
jgi:hypothetical protein